jgi:hypothetical protein
MDVLSRIADPGRDLLGRVDATLLAAGAPPEAPIWPLLRRVGALPGDALEFAAGLDAVAMTDAADEFRVAAREFADRGTDLAGYVEGGHWTGTGAEAFARVWHGLAAHIGDGASPEQESLSGRLVAQASYLDSLASWIAELRAELASTLATCLTSAEAVTLHGTEVRGPAHDPAPVSPAAVAAAAAIGARVLGTVADALRAGHDLYDEWAPWLTELRYRAPADWGASGPASGTRVEL